VLTETFGDGVGKASVASDIAFDYEGSRIAGGGNFLGEGIEEIAAAGGESEARSELGELRGEFGADAGGGSGDEDGFGVKESSRGHGGILQEEDGERRKREEER
jgi:hypothetical protein